MCGAAEAGAVEPKRPEVRGASGLKDSELVVLLVGPNREFNVVVVEVAAFGKLVVGTEPKREPVEGTGALPPHKFGVWE